MKILSCILVAVMAAALWGCVQRETRLRTACRDNCDYLYRLCAEACGGGVTAEGNVPPEDEDWAVIQCVSKCDERQKKCYNDCDSYTY